MLKTSKKPALKKRLLAFNIAVSGSALKYSQYYRVKYDYNGCVNRLNIMLNNYKHHFFVFLFPAMLLSNYLAYGQDFTYSQFYAHPLYLNPALAGSEICSRISLNYRDQWPALPGSFVSYSASFDKYVDFLHGGLGVMVNYDKSGEASVNRAQINAMYAYNFTLSNEVVANLALQAGYGQKSVNWNDFIFESQINPGTGTILPNTPQPANFNGNVNYADFAGGFLLGFDEKYFFGGAVHHLTQPNVSFFDENNNLLKMKITAHAGANIDFEKGYRRSSQPVFSISPNVLYQQQGSFKHLNIGSYFTFATITAGLWYRHAFENPDAVIISVGFTDNNLRAGYSYDYTLSKLSNASGGSHEVSVAWIFGCDKKSRRPKTIICPTF